MYIYNHYQVSKAQSFRNSKSIAKIWVAACRVRMELESDWVMVEDQRCGGGVADSVLDSSRLVDRVTVLAEQLQLASAFSNFYLWWSVVAWFVNFVCVFVFRLFEGGCQCGLCEAIGGCSHLRCLSAVGCLLLCDWPLVPRVVVNGLMCYCVCL